MSRRSRPTAVDLAVPLGPLLLANPIVAASGTFGHGAEVAALCDRVVIIGHGQVLADATVQSIRDSSGAASLEEAFLQVLGDAEGVS